MANVYKRSNGQKKCIAHEKIQPSSKLMAHENIQPRLKLIAHKGDG
jgi:hypothetical protein